MYPNLLLPLTVLVMVCVAGLAVLVLRQPVARRLAGRQVARRKTEAALVVTGSVLGTAIIIGALVVGDTLNHSVRQDAYRTLGPIDERVISTSTFVGDRAAERLAALRADPQVDGILTAQVEQAAAVSTKTTGETAAEPRVLVWDVDLDAAGRFGRSGGDPGLSGPTPAQARSSSTNRWRRASTSPPVTRSRSTCTARRTG